MSWFVIILDVILWFDRGSSPRIGASAPVPAGREPDACTAFCCAGVTPKRRGGGRPRQRREARAAQLGVGPGGIQGGDPVETAHSGRFSVRDVLPGRVVGSSFEGNLGVDASWSGSRGGPCRRVRSSVKARCSGATPEGTPASGRRFGGAGDTSPTTAGGSATHDGGGLGIQRAERRGDPATCSQGRTVRLRSDWKSPGSALVAVLIMPDGFGRRVLRDRRDDGGRRRSARIFAQRREQSSTDVRVRSARTAVPACWEGGERIEGGALRSPVVACAALDQRPSGRWECVVSSLGSPGGDGASNR